MTPSIASQQSSGENVNLSNFNNDSILEQRNDTRTKRKSRMPRKRNGDHSEWTLTLVTPSIASEQTPDWFDNYSSFIFESNSEPRQEVRDKRHTTTSRKLSGESFECLFTSAPRSIVSTESQSSKDDNSNSEDSVTKSKKRNSKKRTKEIWVRKYRKSSGKSSELLIVVNQSIALQTSESESSDSAGEPNFESGNGLTTTRHASNSPLRPLEAIDTRLNIVSQFIEEIQSSDENVESSEEDSSKSETSVSDSEPMDQRNETALVTDDSSSDGQDDYTSDSSVEDSTTSENDSEYEVEAILEKRRGAKVSCDTVSDSILQGVFYKVKWKGFNKPTWESHLNLEGCKILVDNFNQQQNPSGKRKKSHSYIAFGTLAKGKSMEGITTWINGMSSKSVSNQVKSALTRWVSFLLDTRQDKTFKQLLASSPTLLSYFSDLKMNQQFWEWHRMTSGLTHPSTLKNFVDMMRKILSYFNGKISDRLLEIRLDNVGKFWKSQSSIYNKEADRLRDYSRRLTVIKDSGKYVEEEDWQLLSSTSNKRMDEIESSLASGDDLDKKTAESFTQALLWTLGFAMGLPRTSTFTLMDIGRTLVFRDGTLTKFDL